MLHLELNSSNQQHVKVVRGTKRYRSMSQNNIGREVCMRRQRLGLTRRELAYLLRTSLGNIFKMESGRLSPDDECYISSIRFFALTDDDDS